MARFFRRDFDVFPRIYLVSVILGGYCGYVIGEWVADGLLKQANEAKRELMLSEEKKNEILRGVQSMAKQISENERKVEMKEKKSTLKASFDSDKYTYNSGYTGKGKSSSQDINLEGASNK